MHAGGLVVPSAGKPGKGDCSLKPAPHPKVARNFGPESSYKARLLRNSLRLLRHQVLKALVGADGRKFLIFINIVNVLVALFEGLA